MIQNRNNELDLKTSEVMEFPSLVNLLNENSTHLTNNIGKDFTTWHVSGLEKVLEIITVIQEAKSDMAYRFWQDGDLYILFGEWEDIESIGFPQIVKKKITATGSYAKKRAIIKREIQGLGKPINAVEVRIVCYIELFGDREILDLNHSNAKTLIKHCTEFTIIPLWSDYTLRYGYWLKRYYSDTLTDAPATQEEYNEWIDGLEEPMKSKFKADGLEECRGVLNFQRFVAEWRNVGLDEYLKKNMNEEDWKEYKTINSL